MSVNSMNTNVLCTETLLCPRISNATIHKAYRFRYFLVRHLMCPLPCIPHWLPVIGGGKSLLEVLLVLAFVGVGLAICIMIGGSSAGSIASAVGGAAVLCGLRNNILTVIFGVSFERAIFWHKLAALLAVAFGVIHAVDLIEVSSLGVGEQLSGLLLLLFMGVACLAYIVKPYYFEVFYVVHILAFVGAVVTAFMHSSTLMAISVFAWGVDLLVRYLIRVHRISAKARVLPAGVVRIEFPKSFEYTAGQYCFIMIPALSGLQFHPFSLSSAPSEELVCIHIRSLGDWTSSLFDLLEQRCKEQGLESGSPVDLDLFVEGPFGLLSVDLDSPAYQVVVMIAGGIGVTPTQSIFNDLLFKYCSGQRPLKKVILVWSVRDRAMVDHLKITSNVEDQQKSLPASFQPDLIDIKHIRKRAESWRSAEVARSPSFGVAHELHQQPQDTEPCRPNQVSPVEPDTPVVDQGGRDLTKPEPFHCEFYITSLRNDTEFAAAGIDLVAQPYLCKGRPDVPGLFNRIARMCSADQAQSGSRVAVVTCGPQAMIEEVTALCSKSHRGIYFDLHVEEFNF